MKSSTLRVPFALVLMCNAHASPVGAYVPAETPLPAPVAAPVDSFVVRALAQSPDVAELRARLQAAREAVRGAGALPNPMLELMLQDVGFPTYTVGDVDMSMIGPQLTQTIPFPGKRGARRRAAEAGVTVRERELEALRRDLVRDVRVLYARAYALGIERQALVEGREALASIAASARERYSAGSAESEPMIEARLAQQRLDVRLEDLDVESSSTQLALRRLAGADDTQDFIWGRVTALPPTPEAEGFGTLDKSDEAAEVAVRAAETGAAEAELRAARIERLPDFVAGAGVGFRGSMDKVVTLRLGMDLPLWGGSETRAKARVAEQQLLAARAAERGALLSARSDYTRLVHEGIRSQQQVARYRDRIVPDSRLSYESARSNYMVGRGDFTAVLTNFQAWLDARAELARREAEAYSNWAELARLRNENGEATNPGGAR
ncbi:MAG: TolC family protein [Candidatus Eisenbacteria bacterium]|uniref:TolC family protein n=1 Tax=Eiseniibacteriota bacterium TaxID=2212470 RepID=A0A933WC99_UNCEI|nr:TolC family protein [Candidatus Eisenbacteria bacterium]